jgi:hypothetical protein
VDSEFSRKKALVVGVILLLFVAIPATVYVALQQQDTRSRASEEPETTVVAVINGENITKADVRKVAEENNDPSMVDADAMKLALSILEERKILDNAKNSLGITIDQNRVDKFEAEGFTQEQAYYEALRQQVILKAVNSREALSTGFWNPPSAGITELSVEEQQNAAGELAVGIPALTAAQTGLEDNENIDELANQILTDNPELRPVWSVNGFIYYPLSAEDKVLASYPNIYEFGDSGLDDATRNALFDLPNVGDVAKVEDTEANRGGRVFKLINKGDPEGASTYKEWYDQQKASLVQNLGVL